MNLKKLAFCTMALLSTTLTSCGEAVYDMENATTITIGMEAGYEPFNWTNPVSNNHTHQLSGGGYVDGYDVQISKAIAQYLGKTLVIKKIRWEGLVPALKSNSIDLVLAGMTPTADRRESVNFTNEYYRSPITMVVSTTGNYKDATTVADFNGASVVAQAGTIYDDLVSQIPGARHGNALEDYANLALNVQNGANDGFLAEYPVARAITSKNSALKLIELPEGSFDVEDDMVTVAVGTRLVDTALADKVNSALATITPERRIELMDAAIVRSIEAGL